MEIVGTFRIKSPRHGGRADIWMDSQRCALFLEVGGVIVETNVPCSVLSDLWVGTDEARTVDENATRFLEDKGWTK